MKKILLTAIALFSVAMYSCTEGVNSDEILDIKNQNPITVTDDGYLSFNQQSTFDDYIASLKESATNNEATRSLINRKISGFTSLKDLKHNIIATRSEDDEVGSEEEYKLSLCETLLPDEILTNVLDTTMRIAIQDRFYKITHQGTFYGAKDRAQDVEDAIAHFDITKLISLGDNLYQCREGVFI